MKIVGLLPQELAMIPFLPEAVLLLLHSLMAVGGKI